MPKYRIMFAGTPKGGLNSLYNELVDRVVDASNIGVAMLMAYETHEHIDPVTSGSLGIYAEEVVNRTEEDQARLIFNYERSIKRMNNNDIRSECMKLKWFRCNFPDIRGTDIMWKLTVCNDICTVKGILVPTEYGKFGSL